MKFLCDQCKAKYQIADDKVVGKTVRMKCRKCGYQIEVRAAVTESSVSKGIPVEQEGDRTVAQRPGEARGAMKPAALATSLANARPAAPRAAIARPGEKPAGSALSSAFQQTVQKDEAPSEALLDGNSNDDWYVAINGVPVGPVRIAEIRRKAAVGAVTEDSLVWQEGLEEWRPVRTFPELAVAVREAGAAGRASLVPEHPSVPPRTSASQSTVPPPAAAAAKPAAPRAPRPAPAGAPRPSPGASPSPPTASPFAPAAASSPLAAVASSSASYPSRSNVVPIGPRLATAEKLDEMPAPQPASPIPAPVAMSAGSPVVPLAASDPFALPPPAALAATTSEVGSPWGAPAAERASVAAAVPAAPAPIVIESPRRQVPWMAIAMVVLAAAFGITAAIVIFLRPAQPVQPVVIQMSASPNGVPPPTGTTAATAAPTDTGGALPPSTGTAPMKGGPIAAAQPGAKGTTTAPTSTSTGGGLDLSGVGEGRQALADNGSDNGGPSATRPQQCLSEQQMMGVINMHQTGIRRLCWERSPTAKSSANVNVSVSIGPGGEVQSASAGGDDPAVASCVASEVRHWQFPAGGCSQKVSFGYHFVR